MRRYGRFALAFILLIIVADNHVIRADEDSSVRLMVGRSAIISVGSPIARVSLTVPDIADALVTSPSELLINGKTPGTISMFVWDRAGAIKRYEVIVQRDHMVEILSRHSGQTPDRIRADIDRDFILRGNDAVTYGLVDHVIESRTLHPAAVSRNGSTPN